MNIFGRITSWAFIVVSLCTLEVATFNGVAADWQEVFEGSMNDLARWNGVEEGRIDSTSDGLALKGDNIQASIVLTTAQRFPEKKSYRVEVSNLKFATQYNNVSAFLDVGFGNETKDMALCLRLTRFGDGAKIVFNNQSFDLVARPYLNEGKVSIQIEYDNAFRRVTVIQSQGKFKKQEAGVMTVSGPIVLFEKEFPEELDMGKDGTPFMIAAESRGNGGMVESVGTLVEGLSIMSQK